MAIVDYNNPDGVMPEKVAPKQSRIIPYETQKEIPIVKTDNKSMLVDALYGAGQTLKDIGSVLPAIEVAAEFVTSSYGIPVSGLLGGAASLFDGKLGKKVMETAQELLVYRAQSAGGKRLSEAATYPFQKLHEVGTGAGDLTYDLTGSPLLATAIATAIEGAPAVFMGRGAIKSGTKAIGNKYLSSKKKVTVVPESITPVSDKIGATIREELKARGGIKTFEGQSYFTEMQDIHSRGKNSYHEVINKDKVIQKEFADVAPEVKVKTSKAIYDSLSKAEQERLLAKHSEKSGLKFNIKPEKKVAVVTPKVDTIDGLHDIQVDAINKLGQELVADSTLNKQPVVEESQLSKTEFNEDEVKTLTELGVKFKTEKSVRLAEYNAKTPEEKKAIRLWGGFARTHLIDKGTEITKFEMDLTKRSSKAVADLVGDFDTFLGDITDDKGIVIKSKIKGAKAEAQNRIVSELSLIKRDALTEGKSVEQFLIDNKKATPKQAELVNRYMNSIFEPTSETDFKVVSPGKVSGDPEKAWQFIENSWKVKDELGKANRREQLFEVQRAVTDRTIKVTTALENDLRYTSQKALMNFNTISGAYPAANDYYNKVRPHIFDRHNSNELKALEALVHIKKEISVKTRNKNRVGPSGADYEALVEQVQDKFGLDDQRMETLFDSVNRYYEVMGDMLAKKNNAGLVSDELNTLLAENQYSPTEWLRTTFLYDEYIASGKMSSSTKPLTSLEDLERALNKESIPKAGSAQVKSSGLKRLGKGVEGDFQNLNAQEALTMIINETYSKIAKNKATKSLDDYAREVKGNNTTVLPAKISSWGVDSQGNLYPNYNEPPKGYRALNYFEDGQKKELWAKADFAEQWDVGNNDVHNVMLSIAHHLSGASVLRMMATGVGSPLFGLTKGLAMDIPYSYFVLQQVKDMNKVTSLYNPNPFKFAKELTSNIREVFEDTVMRKGEFLKMVEQGGLFGMTGTIGSARAHASSKFMHDVEMLNMYGNYINQTSEYLVRMANRQQYIKQGYSPEDATAAMRNGLDYTQGGYVTKAIDQVVPYKNVAMLGIRNIGKSILKNPKEQGFKFAWMAGIAASMALANRILFPDAIKQESNYNKDNNYIQPTGYSFTDAKGNKRYVNFKMKKEPVLAPYLSLAEMLVARSLGDEIEFKRALNNIVSSGSPVATSFFPPLANAITTMAYNKDSFTLEDIWRKNPAGRGEWTPGKTSQLWFDLGQALNMSPDKMKVAFEDMFTTESLPQRIIENGYDAAFGSLPQKHQDMLMADMLLSNWRPGFVSVTSEPTNKREGIKEAEVDNEAKKTISNIFIDAYADQYYNVDKTTEARKETYDIIMNKIQEYKLDPDEQDRLLDRFDDFKITNKFPHQNMWMMFSGIDDLKLRAREVAKWRNELSYDEQKEIDMRMGDLAQEKNGIIPKDMNSPFWREFDQEVYKLNKEKNK
jgi:hypothetical protein